MKKKRKGLVIRRNTIPVYTDLYLIAMVNGFLYEFVIYLALISIIRKRVFPEFQYNILTGPLRLKKVRMKSLIKRLKRVGLVKIYRGALIIPDQLELLREFKLQYSTGKIFVHAHETRLDHFDQAIDVMWESLISSAKKADIYLDFRDGNPYRMYVLGDFEVNHGACR